MQWTGSTNLLIAQSSLTWPRNRFGGERMTEEQPKPKSKRGLASMSPERRREIARKGGRAVPAEKRAYSQNPELAAKSGQKGGRAVKSGDRAFSRDHALAAAAGKKGGASSKKTGPKDC